MLICSDEGSTGRRLRRRSRTAGKFTRAHIGRVRIDSHATPTVPRYATIRARRRSRDALLARAGVRDDIARDVAGILVDGDLMGHTTHGLALLARLSGRNRARHDGARRASPRSLHASARRADVGRPAPAGTLAHAARARRGDRDGSGPRHRHRRHPPLASHRLPRRLPEARDRSRRDGARLLQRSLDAQRRAVRRDHAGVHAQSARRRHSDVRRSDPARHLGELHDQRPDRATAQGGRSSCRIRGCRMRRATPTRDPGVLFTEPKGTLLPLGGLDAGHKGYALALLVEALTAGLAGHGRADPAGRLGRDGVRAGARSRGVRRRRRVRAADGLARRALPRRDARAPADRRVRMPGERALARYREQSARGVALYPAIMPALRAVGAEASTLRRLRRSPDARGLLRGAHPRPWRAPSSD